MMDSFYVDLISNASMDVYNDNTLSRYTNKLSPLLELDGKWEIGLSEIYYPTNILANKRKFEFVLMTTDDYLLHKNNPQMFADTRFAITIHENTELDNVLKQFNENCKKNFEARYGVPDKDTMEKHPAFEGTNRIEFTAGKSKEKIIIPVAYEPAFFNMLGFTLDQLFVYHTKKVTAKHFPALNIASHLLMVYTDIINGHHVGDTQAALPRTVPLTHGDFKKIAHISFPNPHYYTLRRNRIESIAIVLCDEYGDPIKFKIGRVHITLHFRKAI